MKNCELQNHCENYKIMCDRCKKNVNMHDFFKRKETGESPYRYYHHWGWVETTEGSKKFL